MITTFLILTILYIVIYVLRIRYTNLKAKLDLNLLASERKISSPIENFAPTESMVSTVQIDEVNATQAEFRDVYVNSASLDLAAEIEKVQKNLQEIQKNYFVRRDILMENFHQVYAEAKTDNQMVSYEEDFESWNEFSTVSEMIKAYAPVGLNSDNDIIQSDVEPNIVQLDNYRKAG